MLIALLAYFGGMLTIVSPCILPVLPIVFANAGRSFTRGALPMLPGGRNSSANPRLPPASPSAATLSGYSAPQIPGPERR